MATVTNQAEVKTIRIVDSTGTVIETFGGGGGSGGAGFASLTLGPGTTALAPLQILSGTLATTPVAGMIEFDGTDFYFVI